jgi:starvation-inducible DNA-binding protein
MKRSAMGHLYNDGHNSELKILFHPNLGLDSEVRHSVVELLNHMLASETVLATKTRSAHWNVNGANFYELHTLFETHYQLLNNASNEIAERIRMLGGIAIGTHQEFLQHTWLDEQPGEVPDIMRLLADHEAMTRFLREAAKQCSEEYEEEGTFELLVNMMRLHERLAWILRSNLEIEPIRSESQVI